MPAFILLYQEECSNAGTAVQAGTQTFTKVHAEATDPDERRRDLVLPKQVSSKDHRVSVTATQSFTFVAKEATDKDVQSSLRIFPRCYL